MQITFKTNKKHEQFERTFFYKEMFTYLSYCCIRKMFYTTFN